MLTTKKPRVAQLTHSSVDVHRVIGRDARGQPLLEKVCMLAESEIFCDTDGNEVTIPLQTGRVSSLESREKYGLKHRREQIIAGALPRRDCPYTEKYADVIPGRGPLAQPPDGVKSCGGKPEGCEHYIAVRDLRRADAKARAKERAQISGAMSEAQAAQLAATLGQVVTAAHDLGNAKGNLRAGKGEQIKGAATP